MLRHVRRTTRAATPRATWYAAFVLAALLASFLQLTQAPAPAQAATVATFAAPDLLNPRVVADATPAQADALRRFQAQAVDLTLAHYGLPAGDREAVKSWGRTEAQAMLWGLMVQAVQTPGAERSADQWNVRHWLAALTKHEVEETARATGLEYAKWAGLDLDTYRRLAKSGSEFELRNFFALPGSLIGGSTANCAYVPPAPYAGAFDLAPTCVLSPPTSEQFARWGAASQHESTWDPKLAHGLASLAGVINTSALHVGARRDATASAVASEALRAGAAGLTLHNPATANAVPGGHLVGHVPELSVLAPWPRSVFTDLRKRVHSASGALSRALVTNVQSLPVGAQVAALVVRARTSNPAPEPMLSFADSQTVLFSLFVGATLPAPLTFANCDNSLIPLAQYGSPHLAWANIIDPSTGVRTQVRTSPCLNTVPAPAPSIDDPQFIVQRQGSDYFVQSPTIAVRIDDDNLNTVEPRSTVRMAGNGWFVHRITNGKTPLESDVRTLGMEYTDWQGHRNYVSLVRTSEGGYRFLGVTETSRSAVPSLDTCRATYSCWDSDSIDYLGPDGQPYTARVVDYQKPAGSPWHSVGAVTGSPVQFEANGFAPAYNNGSVTYAWRFQKDGCHGPCAIGPDPVYTSPVPGPNDDPHLGRSRGPTGSS